MQGVSFDQIVTAVTSDLGHFTNALCENAHRLEGNFTHAPHRFL